MITRIGKRAAPGDAVDLLLECHERIRSFVALARRMCEGARPAEEVRDAALRVHRYFAEALPLHARDEDESVVPRLRGLDPAVDAELAAMSREHREHERPVAALVAACRELADDPARLPALAPVVSRAAAELERGFVEHLAREEAVVFPAMRRLLAPEAAAAIVSEIRQRRGGAVTAPGEPAAPAR